MSSSIGTYLVLVTAGLSLTYLSFLLYTAYGLGALRVAAPFIGTIALVFGECLSRKLRAVRNWMSNTSPSSYIPVV